jgi:hypothetical protein
MKINPVQVQGAWRLGWALDVHTTSSEFIGYDQNGHAQFNTTRSPLGELLYQKRLASKESRILKSDANCSTAHSKQPAIP